MEDVLLKKYNGAKLEVVNIDGEIVLSSAGVTSQPTVSSANTEP